MPKRGFDSEDILSLNCRKSCLLSRDLQDKVSKVAHHSTCRSYLKLIIHFPGEPLPEALIWLLLTSEIPSIEQTKSLTAEFRARSTLPPHVEQLIRSLPKGMHPMTQLSIGVLACQTGSKFAAAYEKGVNKSKYWEHTLEDVLDVIAKLPEIAALIYRCSFKDGKLDKDTSGTLDYSASFNRMLGYNTPDFDELMRLYLVIHSDHEGGNASAHSTHLVASTLSDPYLAFSGGLNALAGPLVNPNLLHYFFLKLLINK